MALFLSIMVWWQNGCIKPTLTCIKKHTIAPSFKRMYVALCFFMFLSYLTQFSNPTVTAQNYKTQVVNLGIISILLRIHVLFILSLIIYSWTRKPRHCIMIHAMNGTIFISYVSKNPSFAADHTANCSLCCQMSYKLQWFCIIPIGMFETLKMYVSQRYVLVECSKEPKNENDEGKTGKYIPMMLTGVWKY